MEQLSFRDPAGIVYNQNGKILRKIKIEKFKFIENLFSQDWYKNLVNKKKIQKSVIVLKDKDHFTIEHELFEFIVMPHEMCDQQLFNSAILTLDLAIEGIKNDTIIKDASAWNIFFLKSMPIFCDITSFEPWNNSPNWIAYGQFFRHFLIPLILSKELGMSTSELFLTNRDGITPEKASKLLGFKKFKKFLYIEGIFLPLLFRNKNINQKKFDKPLSKNIFLRTLKRLKKYTLKLKPSENKTIWTNYEIERSHYSKEDIDTKFLFIKKIANNKYKNVLDLGCNEGEYSKVFATNKSNVISTDFDDGCLNKLLNQTKKMDISVFKVNIANPTPAIGWKNNEQLSFLNRMRKKFDLVLCLGLIHHLQVTERIPVIEIINLLSDLTKKNVIIEYIPKNDEKFIQIAGTNLNLYNDYSEEFFEKFVLDRFEILEKKILINSKRILYYLKLK